MKKILFLLALSAACCDAIACDICGCGVGNSYIGILPDFSKHILGLRYRTNSMLTHVGAGGVASYLTTRERYRTLELWGGWTIGSSVRIMASMPYAFNERTNQGSMQSKSGVGDASLAGYYQLINQRKPTGNKLFVQSLWIGAGIKAPTGKYNPSDKLNSTDAANLFQLGTGSVDFSLNAMYDLRLQDAGLNTTLNYKMNTANKYNYQYGNKFGGNTQLYYKFRVKSAVTISPNVGIGYESSAKDAERGFSVDISGGNLLLGTLGVEANVGKVLIGANYQTPFSQQLANGMIKANDRAMVHLSFLL